jgi:hypothetical protein
MSATESRPHKRLGGPNLIHYFVSGLIICSLSGCDESKANPATANPAATKTYVTALAKAAVDPKTYEQLFPSLCQIARDLAEHHIADAGTHFSMNAHDPLHKLLADVESVDPDSAAALLVAKNNFEAQALSYRITMSDDLPALLAATKSALAVVAPVANTTCT